MPTCTIRLNTVAEHPGGTGTGTYEKIGVDPGNIDITNWGDIEITGHSANLDLTFVIHDDLAYEFDEPGFTAVMESPFGPPNNNPSNSQCTVPDDNDRPAYHYTLHLINDSKQKIAVHPKIINK